MNQIKVRQHLKTKKSAVKRLDGAGVVSRQNKVSILQAVPFLYYKTEHYFGCEQKRLQYQNIVK